MSAMMFGQMYKHREYAPLILRVVIGVVFALHGWQKLSTIGVGNFAGMLGWAGPLAIVLAWIVTLVEILGGLALILGAFTRLSALLLAIIMVVALLMVQLPGALGAGLPFGLLCGGGGPCAERDLTLLAGLLALFILGGGIWALDKRIFPALPD